MARKRPCAVCRKWFQPHPRAGKRQRVCGEESCQRERNRRNCAEWQRKNPDYHRERRARERIERDQPEDSDEAIPLGMDPLEQLDWAAAERAAGYESTKFLRRAGRLLVGWTQHAVRQARSSK